VRSELSAAGELDGAELALQLARHMREFEDTLENEIDTQRQQLRHTSAGTAHKQQHTRPGASICSQ